MAILVQHVSEIIRKARLSKPLSEAGLTDTTDSEPIVVVDGIGWAMRQLGYSLATPTQVSDADLSVVQTDEIDDLLALTELRVLLTCIHNIATTDERFAEHGAWRSQYPKRLMAMYDKLYAQLAKRFEFDAPEPQFDVLTLERFINAAS